MPGPFKRGSGERGSVLVCVLVVAAAITALGGAVVFVATTDTMISANYRSSQRVMYAGDAGIERAIGSLRALSDWRMLPDALAVDSDLDDGATDVRLSDGTRLDLAGLTAEQQRCSDAVFEAAPDRPVWRLFVHAPFDRMLPPTTGGNPEYIAVWVADDPEELDGDPLHDSNDVVMLHGEAFGFQGGRWRIDLLVGRERIANERNTAGALSGGIRVLSWREGE